MILVINQPYIDNFNRAQRWAARTRGRALRPPDWLAYATAVLESRNMEVKLFDFPALNWTKKELRQILRKYSPEFVVLDSTTPSIYSDIECAQICKEESNARVIMTGPHASALPIETMQLGKGYVDVICKGEFDYTVADVIDNINNLPKVKGIYFWDKDNIFFSGDRKHIQELDDLPYPAYSHLNLWDYFDAIKRHPFINIFSSRGCPYKCSFCLWPQVMHGNKTRFRKASSVVDEMEYEIDLFPWIKKRGEFFFEDDTFNVSLDHAKSICEEIINRNLKVVYSANVRYSNFDDEFFLLLKRSGCRMLLVGFESGDQMLLDSMQKSASLYKAEEFTSRARINNIKVHGCFVLGLPGESIKTMSSTLNLSKKLGIDSAQYSAAVPYPGTSFYDFCQERNYIKYAKWDKWLKNGEQSSITDYPELKSVEIDNYVDKGLRSFYLSPVKLFNRLIKYNSKEDMMVQLRGGYNMLRYLLGRCKWRNT
jgi:anaerobic magnesium-protoporphyrin IX monomethyl ester cyclase